MMRRPSTAFVALATLLGGAILFALTWSPSGVPLAPPARRPRLEPSATVPASPSGATGERLRNVFAYEEPQSPPAPSRVFVPEVAVPPPLALPPPNPVALVGFVRQGGELRAAVSIHGTVSVLAKDESSEGYVVLAIDEDRGVTLRAPDGADVTLVSPPGR
jgi:hypothetical protein